MGFRILLQNSLTVHHSDVCIKFLHCTSFGCHFLHEAQHIFVMDIKWYWTLYTQRQRNDLVNKFKHSCEW